MIRQAPKYPRPYRMPEKYTIGDRIVDEVIGSLRKPPTSIANILYNRDKNIENWAGPNFADYKRFLELKNVN